LWGEASVADAHRSGDGKRFVVHADEKPPAFIELESAIHRDQPVVSSDWLGGVI
jgi:hypothetical protein